MSLSLCVHLRSIIAVIAAMGIFLTTCGCSQTASSPVTQTQTDPNVANGDDIPVPTDPQKNIDFQSESMGKSLSSVFFDDPLAVAAESDSNLSVETDQTQLTGGPEEVESTMPNDSAVTPSETTTSPEAIEAESSEPVADWQKLASLDVLNEEVKQLRNRLTANLKTVATYNRNIDAVANDGVVLAGIAAVVAVHPGSLSWQENAPLVRNLAGEVAANASGTGREPYAAAQTAFEQIVTVLNGGSPADSDAVEIVPFADVADRSELMKRTKRSFDWLKSEINTQTKFEENASEIQREATVLAVFGGLISTDSYDSADEPQYQQFVREFVEANLAINSAVQVGSYEEFSIARDRVQNACAACHGEYAFGDEGL